MAYLLDTNIFIEAKNGYYGFDFCPAFWEWLERENQAGRVFSIEKVADELAQGTDDLAEWARARGSGFFLPPDAAMLDAMATVSEWVSAQSFLESAISAFLEDADYYLISFALAHGHTVVTREIPSDGLKQVKIPNVCFGLGIKCMAPYAMLRTERARFVLDQASGRRSG